MILSTQQGCGHKSDASEQPTVAQDASAAAHMSSRAHRTRGLFAFTISIQTLFKPSYYGSEAASQSCRLEGPTHPLNRYRRCQY